MSNSTPSAPIDRTALFAFSKLIPPKFRGLPASPFLVPAVLDALRNSAYADVVEVVPWEADAFCAAAARRVGGVVLTSDSDLLVHNLGMEGAVVFFDSLELGGGDGVGEHCWLSAAVARPVEVADSLGLESLRPLAFVLKEDSSAGFLEAVRRAKGMRVEGESSELYRAFREEYSDIIVQPQSRKENGSASLAPPSLLDPGISEFVLQCQAPSSGTVHVYLPFVIEDPSSFRLVCFGVDSMSCLYTCGRKRINPTESPDSTGVWSKRYPYDLEYCRFI